MVKIRGKVWYLKETHFSGNHFLLLFTDSQASACYGKLNHKDDKKNYHVEEKQNLKYKRTIKKTQHKKSRPRFDSYWLDSFAKTWTHNTVINKK